MQLTFEPARLTGFAILAVAGATALSVGACSSSKNAQSPATSSSSPAASKAKNKDSVQGQVASVSGNAVQVTLNNGTATVDVSPSAKVTEYTKAQLTDIAAGNCVTVFTPPPHPAPGGPVTATAVNLSPPAGDGKCPQPKNKVIGTVASVAGNTIHVTVTDANGNPADTTVTVTDKTVYNKGVSATSQAIAQGKCITAHGTKDGGGTLKATIVALGPANDGKCPEPAAQQHPH
jgi:hypothetical protein